MITSELLEAYLACTTKCYLRSKGEVGSGNTYATWNRMRNDSYRRTGIGRLAGASSHELAGTRIDPSRLKKARWQLAFDQVLQAENLEAHIHAIQRSPADRKERSSEFTPIRFSHVNKPSRANRIAAGFDALVLSKIVGQPIDVAQITHGEIWSNTKVRTAALLRELTKIIGELRTLLAAASPPDLVLNRHCPECEFRDRCRKEAIEKDDLSLLAGMTDKERVRLNRRAFSLSISSPIRFAHAGDPSGSRPNLKSIITP